jgi:type IV fimbrial biogenesis protein FimT
MYHLISLKLPARSQNSPSVGACVRRNAGHTLVEICLTLAVSAALLSMSAIAVEGLIADRVVEGAAAEFAQDIQYARAQAVASNRNITIGFRSTGAAEDACYSLYTGVNGACVCQPSGESICTEDSSAIKTVVIPRVHGVTMVANVPRMLIENGRGLVTPAGFVSISAREDRALKQIVNIVGRVRTCASGAPFAGYPSC